MKAQHKKFAKLWLKGVPAGRAYEQAGYTSRGNVADICASRLLKNAKVKDYIDKMNDKDDKATILSVSARKELLTRIALANEDERPSDAIRATAELSKMDGAYEPEKQEQSVNIIIGGKDEDHGNES
jgi:phage terminase small subunit